MASSLLTVLMAIVEMLLIFLKQHLVTLPWIIIRIWWLLVIVEKKKQKSLFVPLNAILSVNVHFTCDRSKMII